MKISEKGFTLVEILVAFSIVSVIILSAPMVIFPISRGNERNTEYITSVRQVENAGYWIGLDTQMAHSVVADNLTLPDFLIFGWIEWDAGGEPTYHSVRYFFEDMTDSVGKLKRYHWSSDGNSEQTLIAQYIYCDADNVTHTSTASYQNPMLAVKLTYLGNDMLESREFKIIRRPNY